jgi:hypothetical protein
MKTHCEDHSELTERIATETERARALERERDEVAVAVLSLEGRLRHLEGTVARWGGIIAGIATLPLLVQIAQFFIRAAEAGR